MFFNIGGGEILVIAMVALIAVGPEQLPSVLRKAGKAMAQVRSMTSGLRDEFMSGIDEVSDIVKPESWMGSGTADDPVVPKGYAERQKAAEEAKLAADGASNDSAPNDSASNGGASSDSASNDTADEDTVDEGAATNGDSSNGDGRPINKIAQANAMSADDTPRPKPSIGGTSTAAPRPADEPSEPEPAAIDAPTAVDGPEGEATDTDSSADGEATS